MKPELKTKQDQEALWEAIKKGKITTSLGGNNMEGAWVIVMLYDYYHGIDFADQGVVRKLKLDILTKDNINNYLKYLEGKDPNRIDFRRFSKKLNPNLKQYNFGLKEILKQF